MIGFSIYIDLNLPILSGSHASTDAESKNTCQYIHKGQVSILAPSATVSEIVGQTNRKKQRKSTAVVETNTRPVSTELSQSVTHQRNFSVIKAYRSSVYAASLGDKEMLVIENPWVRILENLPATLSRKRYGT